MMMDQELEKFRLDILYCLATYGGLPNEEAERVLSETTLLDVKTQLDRDMLFRELPYYWAMELLYAEKFPNWHRDPELWPPPKDYVEHLQRQRAEG